LIVAYFLGHLVVGVILAYHVVKPLYLYHSLSLTGALLSHITVVSSVWDTFRSFHILLWCIFVRNEAFYRTWIWNRAELHGL